MFVVVSVFSFVLMMAIDYLFVCLLFFFVVNSPFDLMLWCFVYLFLLIVGLCACFLRCFAIYQSIQSKIEDELVEMADWHGDCVLVVSVGVV